LPTGKPGVSGSSWTSNINGSTNYSKGDALDGATVTTYLSGHFWRIIGFRRSRPAVQDSDQRHVRGVRAHAGRRLQLRDEIGRQRNSRSAFGELRNEALDANSFVNNSREFPRAGPETEYAFKLWRSGLIPKVYHGRNKSFFYASYDAIASAREALAHPSKTAPLPEFYEAIQPLLGPPPGSRTAWAGCGAGRSLRPDDLPRVASGRYVGDMFPQHHR